MWECNMTKDMIKLDSFLDVSRFQTKPANTADSDKWPHSLNARASAIHIPKL
jgi:hypothetical protein